MLNETNLFFIFLSAFLINNILLIRFLGLCSFIGISTNIKSSIGMGIAVVFVTVMACSISWAVYNFLLIPLHLEYLRTITFILTIASFVQFEEMIIRKKLPTLYRA
ncbi:MAG: electron transport complex protein RnfA, partial [Candidatus Ratteibacteria bacterium]